MSADQVQWVGWVATAMTVGSYFCRSQLVLRRIQAVAAVVWMSYGVMISARPIITANLIVAGVAAWSTLRGRGRDAPPASLAGNAALPKDA